MTYLPGQDHLLNSIPQISLGHRAPLRAHPRGQGQLEQVQGNVERGEALGIEGTRAILSQELFWDWGTGFAGSLTSPCSSRI